MFLYFCREKFNIFIFMTVYDNYKRKQYFGNVSNAVSEIFTFLKFIQGNVSLFNMFFIQSALVNEC